MIATVRSRVSGHKSRGRTRTFAVRRDDVGIARVTLQRVVDARSSPVVTMGLTFTKLFQRLFSKKEMRILMVRRRARAQRPYLYFFEARGEKMPSRWRRPRRADAALRVGEVVARSSHQTRSRVTASDTAIQTRPRRRDVDRGARSAPRSHAGTRAVPALPAAETDDFRSLPAPSAGWPRRRW